MKKISFNGFRKSTFLALTLGVSMLAQAADSYETGFEGPVFSPGDLNGQEGWVAGDGGIVQSTIVNAGNQAVRIDSIPGEQAASVEPQLPLNGQKMILQAAVHQVEDSESIHKQSGLYAVGDTGFIGQIVWRTDGVALGNYDSETTRVPFAWSQWHNLRIVFDFESQTMEGFVNAVSLGSLPINPGGGPAGFLTDMGVYTVDPVGEDTPGIYFDDFSFLALDQTAPVPLMSNLAVLILVISMLGIAALRLRRAQTFWVR